MIESISAITLATHDMPRAVRFYSVLGFQLLHGGEDHHSPAFAQELAISTSSVSLPRGTGPGGDGSSSTLPMSTRFTSVHALRDTSQPACRATPNGESASSIWSTPTATSSVLPGHCRAYECDHNKKPRQPEG